MLRLPCPYCGLREIDEFAGGDEAHILRPVDPSATTDAQWADMLYYRENPRGVYLERWVHRHGCNRWFNLARDTVTDEVIAAYPIDAQPPPQVAAKIEARRAGSSGK